MISGATNGCAFFMGPQHDRKRGNNEGAGAAPAAAVSAWHGQHGSMVLGARAEQTSKDTAATVPPVWRLNNSCGGAAGCTATKLARCGLRRSEDEYVGAYRLALSPVTELSR